MDFLVKYRGKKIMFVGDSLSLNQFNSLACMIHSWVPNTRTSFTKKDALSIITFQVSFHHVTPNFFFSKKKKRDKSENCYFHILKLLHLIGSAGNDDCLVFVHASAVVFSIACTSKLKSFEYFALFELKFCCP